MQAHIQFSILFEVNIDRQTSK